MSRLIEPPASHATWDRLAARYGAQERLELTAIDAALALAAPRPGERLVDLATGTGLLLRRLAARTPRPREAIGVDHSTAMLAQAGELPAGWSVRHADARAVALPDGWADVVSCAYLLHLLDDGARRAVLAEAHRLLRPAPASRLVVVTVWGARRAIRASLRIAARARPAALGALNPLDPAPDLDAGGFTITHRASLPRHGYPSLVLLARPSFRSP